LSIGFHRSAGRHARSATAALVALLVATAAPLGAPVAAVDRSAAAPPIPLEARRAPEVVPPDVASDPAGLQPSIQYEEAEAHRLDRIEFTPGGRVTVGFTPRDGDRWTVGGTAPTGLPAGRLDGRAMRSQADEPAATPTLPGPTVDLPTETTPAEPATSASFVEPAPSGTVSTEAAITPAGLRREIFGFLPYWQVNSSSLRLDYTRISTVAYFGIGADAGGNLQKRNADGTTSVGWSGWTSSKMTSIISAAHHNHTRVVLTVQSFGWNTSGLARQAALLGSPTARSNLANQIAAAVRDRGADGVNLDFEPLAPGHEAEFTSLVRGVRVALNRIHSGYQITFDTTGSIGNYPIEAAIAPGGADAIFVMGYDYRNGSSSPVGSVAPLDRTGYDIRDTVIAYTSRVPASKVILGVPYYGRAWSTASDALNASNTSSTKTGASTTITYDTAAAYLAQYGRRYDPTEAVAWTAYQRQNCTTTYGCVTSWRQIYVDDAATLGLKYNLVNQYGLRGAGIWALGYDGTRPELWNAIKAKFITDTTAPTVGVKTLPATAVNPGFTVTWGGVDDVAIASYDTQASIDGGPWIPWLNATRAAAAVWNGEDGHAYAFRVRARDPKGNVSPWNVASTSPAVAASIAVGGFGVVRTDGLSVRSAGDTSATKLGTLSAGDLLAIVGGPRVADGYTWFQVVGPLTEWNAVRPAFRGSWVAVKSSAATMVAPAKAPNATRVAARIGGLGFDRGAAASIGAGTGAVDRRSFSPNGDGSRDGMRLDWTNAVALDGLVLRIFRADGTVAGDVPLDRLAAGAQSATWGGLVGGSRLPDGRYLASLIGTVGTATYFNPSLTFLASSLATRGLTIDTVAPKVTAASASGSLLSPNGDGVLDTIRVALAASGARTWAFGVAPVTGATVGAPIVIRSGSGTSAIVTWNGRTDAGAVAPDGVYRLQLVAADPAGNRVSRTWTVRVDATAPAIAATAPATFSPNRDGAFDTARLAWSSSETISGTARIYHGSTLVRSWPIAARASGAITWTGTNSAGSLVADGTYAFRVSGRDAAGNLTTRTIGVKVDRTLSTLRWSAPGFFPQDGDRLAATSRLTFTTTRTALVSAAIYSGATVVRTIWTNRTLGAGPHAWTWDGRDGSAAIVARGTYVVRVTATSAFGTSALTRSVVADAFTIGTSPGSPTAGQTLSVTVRTIETLRAAPTISFTQAGKTPVRKTAISLGGGLYRVTFTVAAGAPGPARIVVSGRDTAGGLNTSSRTVAVR
jgi:spore germination protein YaaH/flagellar hook assembly protein FlgD